MNQSKDTKFIVSGTKTPFLKKYFNQLCKVLTSVNKEIILSLLKFDCKVKFSKLINSVCSLPSIEISRSVINFEGDCKINKHKKFAWSEIRLSVWTLTENTFIALIKIFALFGKYNQIKITISLTTVLTDDPLFELLLQKLFIAFNKETNKIFIKGVELTNEYLEYAMKVLE